MTQTVSISEFRNHISKYLDLVVQGATVVLRDEKKNQEIAEIIGKKKFDLESYKITLRRVAGIFTAQNHPEWKTRRDIEKWLRSSRRRAERKFDASS